MAIAGFARMRALSTSRVDSPAEASRPFDAGRDGFVMGEGAGVLVLEELSHAQRRGARVYCELRGFGMASDAFHIAQPPPDGRGAAAAVRASLRQAGLDPGDIGHVNAHATSTPQGDRAEVAGLVSVFGEHASGGALAVSSTKGATGHLLGAAGAVEAIFAILALRHKLAPPTLNLTHPDVGHPGVNLVPLRRALSAPHICHEIVSCECACACALLRWKPGTAPDRLQQRHRLAALSVASMTLTALRRPRATACRVV